MRLEAPVGKLLTAPVLLVAAVFYGALLTLATLAGLFGMWLGFILLLSLWRYSYQVLTASAQGHRELPAASLDSMNPVGDWRVVAHFVAFPALLTMLAVTQPFGSSAHGTLLNWGAIAAATLLFPASASMMALTTSLEAAFDPVAWRHVIATLGRDYFKLVAVCCALVGGALWVPRVLPTGLLSSLASAVVLVWAVLATFAAIGGALRAHRDDFEIPGEIEPEEERQSRERRGGWQKRLDEAYGSLRSGLVTEGYELLRRFTAEQGESLEVYAWLFDQMLGWEDRSHAVAVAERLIAQHIAAGDRYTALEVALRCRRAVRGYRLPAHVARTLADFARSLGQQGVADELMAASRDAPVGAERGD